MKNIVENMVFRGVELDGEYEIVWRNRHTQKIEDYYKAKNAITLGVDWRNYSRQMTDFQSENTFQGTASGVGSMQVNFPSSEAVRNTYNWQSQLFDRLYLTDNSEPLDREVSLPQGNIVGWAWNESVSADDRQGIFLRNKPTDFNNKKAVYRFQFGHTKGNGKFQSAFMGNHPTDNFQAVRGRNYMSYTQATQPQTARAGVLDGDLMYYAASSPNTLFILNYKTCELTTRPLPEPPATHRCQCGKIGNSLYYINSSNILVRLNLDTMQVTARTAVTEMMFFEADGSIYCPQSFTRNIRRYNPDLTLAETITVTSTNVFEWNGGWSFNYDYSLNRVVGVSPSETQGISTTTLADFLATGLNTFGESFVFGLRTLGNHASTQAQVFSAFVLPSGNVLTLGMVPNHPVAVTQYYKYQGIVGSAILFDTEHEKTENQEMTITYTVNFGGMRLVE
jgi:hypothetical protein